MHSLLHSLQQEIEECEAGVLEAAAGHEWIRERKGADAWENALHLESGDEVHFLNI